MTETKSLQIEDSRTGHQRVSHELHSLRRNWAMCPGYKQRPQRWFPRGYKVGMRSGLKSKS